jgi:tetratricopeptide (TPR) repeat protein
MSETHTQLDTPALNVGDKLSQFEVTQQLGSGGSSVVWLAHDALLDRYVAIKQLLVSSDHEEAFHARFRQEAALLKRLSEQEPRLVKMIEHIDDERGAFIITEYIDGPSLDQVMSQNGEPSGVRGALRILYALTQAMITIHGAGVIHRDLKPSNILLPREGGLKVCDLGLAALIAEQEALTLGSARYMAPELFRGETADGRADIYSVGIILYELLSGRTQFETTFKTVVRDQRDQAMRWMKWHTNTRLTAPPLKQNNPNVPTRLSDLVARMMEKDPAKRVGSAQELMEAIERHFSREQHAGGATAAGTAGGDPAETGADTTGDTAPLPKRRVWPWALAGSGGALAVLILAIALLVGGGGNSGPDPVAQASGLMNEAKTAYNNGDFTEARQKYDRALSLLTGAAGRGDDQAGEARAGLLAAEVRASLQADRFSEARDSLDKLRDVEAAPAKQVARLSDDLERASAFDSSMDQIASLIDAGNLDRAEQRLLRWQDTALSEKERQRREKLKIAIAGQRQQRAVQSVLDEVNQLVAQNRRDAAIERLEEAQDDLDSSKLRDKLESLRQARRLDEITTQAERAAASGQVRDAIEHYQDALEIEDDPALQKKLRALQARQQIERAGRLKEVGNLEAAAEAYNRALGFAEEGSEAHQQAQQALADLDRATERQKLVEMADKAYETGDYDVAIRQYERAIEMSGPGQKAPLEEKLAAAKADRLVEQGNQALADGELEQARELYEQARSLQQGAAGTEQGLAKVEHRLKYRNLVAKGDAMRQQGRYSEARTQYRKARDTLNTDEIQQRLEDVRYEHLMLKAENYMDAKQWRQAESQLLTIRNQVRDTEQVRQKLETVRQRLAAQGPQS